MPYKDPAKKREWDDIHRPNRKFERLGVLHDKRNSTRIEILAREAYNETEEGLRKHAACDSDSSWEFSTLNAKTRLKLR